jgi:hypothetical protein
MRALGWTLVRDLRKGDDSPTTPGVSALSVTIASRGGGDPKDSQGIVLTFWAERAQDTTLRPAGQSVWAFGVSTRELFAKNPHAGDITEGQHDVFAAMLAFIQQRIVVPSRRMSVSSTTRKHVAREHPEHVPLVRVVALRRVASVDYHPPETPTGRHVAVTFRVRGFWRQQCHDPHHHAERGGTVDDGGSCLHQPVYIHPFMKGHGPLKMSSATVADVMR